MAGAGWRDFVPGEVLTAANVQDYLQDQAVMTFASAAARTSALASPTDGMVSYLKDSDMVEIYDGSAWTRYGGGLVPIAPSSVTYVTGSGSTNTLGQMTFTGCTKVEVNGVFTSAYRNYRVLFNAGGSTSSTAMYMRLRTAGTDLSSGSYTYGGANSIASVGLSSYSGLNSSGFDITWVSSSGGNYSSAAVDVFAPNEAVRTTVQSSAFSNYSSGLQWLTIGGRADSTLQHDGFSFTVNAGTMTGAMTVYGYND